MTQEEKRPSFSVFSPPRQHSRRQKARAKARKTNHRPDLRRRVALSLFRRPAITLRAWFTHLVRFAWTSTCGTTFSARFELFEADLFGGLRFSVRRRRCDVAGARERFARRRAKHPRLCRGRAATGAFGVARSRRHRYRRAWRCGRAFVRVIHVWRRVRVPRREVSVCQEEYVGTGFSMHPGTTTAAPTCRERSAPHTPHLLRPGGLRLRTTAPA